MTRAQQKARREVDGWRHEKADRNDPRVHETSRTDVPSGGPSKPGREHKPGDQEER